MILLKSRLALFRDQYSESSANEQISCLYYCDSGRNHRSEINLPAFMKQGQAPNLRFDLYREDTRPAELSEELASCNIAILDSLKLITIFLEEGCAS